MLGPDAKELGTLTEPREFNLMFKTYVGRAQRRRRGGVPAARNRPGHLRQLQERARQHPRAGAVRHRPDGQELPQRNHAAELHVPRASSSRWKSSSSAIRKRRRSGTSTGAIAAIKLVHRPGAGRRSAAAARARAGRTEPLLGAARPTSSTRSRSCRAGEFGELEGIAHRGDFDLRSHMEGKLVTRRGNELVVELRRADGKPKHRGSGKRSELSRRPDERAVHSARDRAFGRRRSRRRWRSCARPTTKTTAPTKTGKMQSRVVMKFHPRLRPIKAAVFPLVKKDGMPEIAQEIYRDAEEAVQRLLRREGRRRPPLPSPGRSRHAVLHHGRRPDAHRSNGHDPRSRLAQAVARQGRRRRERNRQADQLVENAMLPTLSQVCSLSSPFEKDLEDYAAGHVTSVEPGSAQAGELRRQPLAAGCSRVARRFQADGACRQLSGGLLAAKGKLGREAWELFHKRIALCREVGIGTIVVAGDILPPLDQAGLGRVKRRLCRLHKRAARLGSRRLEFQSSAVFGNNLQTAAALGGRGGSPHLGLCFDVFHYHCGPSKADDLGYLTRDNLFHVQLCDLSDVPARTSARDADRILPGDGDLPPARRSCVAARDRLRRPCVGRTDEPTALASAGAAIWRDRDHARR